MKHFLEIVCAALLLTAVSASAANAEIITRNTEHTVVSQSGARDSVRADLISRGATTFEATEMSERMRVEDVVYFESDPARSQPGGLIIFILLVVVLVLLIIVLSEQV